MVQNINFIKKSEEFLLEASKEVGLEKTKYMVISRHQNAGKNHNLLIANKSFENMAELGTTATNQDCIQEEIKRGLHSEECFLHFCSESCVFPSPLQILKIKIYRAIILSFVLFGCETWSLTLREMHILRMFENRVLRRIFVPKKGSCGRLERPA